MDKSRENVAFPTATPPTESGDYWVRVDGRWDVYWFARDCIGGDGHGIIYATQDEEGTYLVHKTDILWGCKIECPYVDKEGE